MKFPLIDPRDTLALVARGPAMVEQALQLVPRALGLLDQAELLLARADLLVDQIDDTRRSADDIVERASDTVTDVNKLIVRIAGTVASVEPTLARAERLLDSFAPSLERLQPTLDRLAETTHPEEVDALVALIDHLPDLVERFETDILPMMTSLRSVGPDIHELLDLTRQVNEMLAKLPGLGRLRKKGDKQGS